MEQTAVVILNWNGVALLKEFLPIVIENTQGAEVVVVDNCSTDNSVEYLKNSFSSVKTVVLDKNYGFAGGYNRAIKLLEYDSIILLNSDAAPAPNWVAPLISILNSSSTTAIVVPKIKDYKSPQKFEYAGAAGGFIDCFGYPYCRGRLFDTIEDDCTQYDGKKNVFWASGAAFAIKRELFLQLGGFDEDFFAHQEEIDLCWRVNNAGYDVMYNSDSVVYHLGGATLNSSNPKKTYLNFRNNLYMITKNYPFKGLVKVILVKLVLDGLAGVRFLLSGKINDCLAIIKAHFSFYSKYTYFYKKRGDSKPRMILHPLIRKQSIVWDYFIRKKVVYSDLN